MDVVNDLYLRMSALEAAQPGATIVAACDRITVSAVESIETAMVKVARALDALDAQLGPNPARRPSTRAPGPRSTRPPPSNVVPFTRHPPPRRRR
jgi:hypothetical protein